MQEYLDLLGIEQPVPITVEGLTRLTRAQTCGVPFESVTSVLRRAECPDGPVPPLDVDRLLEAWTERRGGGVCFEIVAGFGRVLHQLGFQTQPVNACVGWPGSHQALLVQIDAARYLVDVGNGAPFTEPIALDRVVEVRRAGLAYRFRPAETSSDWIQDRWIEGAWAPFCVYDLATADADVRERAYQRHHARGQSWVVDTLVLTRCDNQEVWSLRDDELRHFTPSGKSVERITEPAAYARLAAEVFHVPGLPIDAARRVLADHHRQRQ